MEEKTRQKRSSGAPQRKERRDAVKSGSGRKSSTGIIKKGASSDRIPGNAAIERLGIRLDAGTARQAVILSEIIGKPVSKRGRRR